jgi:hypothetical protein
VSKQLQSGGEADVRVEGLSFSAGWKASKWPRAGSQRRCAMRGQPALERCARQMLAVEAYPRLAVCTGSPCSRARLHEDARLAIPAIAGRRYSDGPFLLPC